MRISIVDGQVTRDLRRAILRPGWPEGSPMHGDDNPAAVHFAAIADDGAVIGTALVLPHPYPPRPARPDAWQLRGMATAADHQGQGIGAQVLGTALAEVVERGGRLVWCEARTSALAFYRRNGFAVEGDEYLHAESGIPHHRMWRELSAAPTASLG